MPWIIANFRGSDVFVLASPFSFPNSLLLERVDLPCHLSQPVLDPTVIQSAEEQAGESAALKTLRVSCLSS